MLVSVPFQTREEDGTVRCGICPQNCRIKPGRQGTCRVRINRDGELWALNYGEVAALALDPIEKKPLYHFHPGKAILSAGTVGCNLACGFCQNYQIAHENPPTRYVEPELMAALASEYQERGSVGLAFTYSEPLMWFEYVMDTAPLIKEKGLANILVTNGYINPEPLGVLLPFIDALNIDLKSFREDFYRRNCKGRLEPVKKTIEMCYEHAHVEITTLLVTGENDNPDEIEELAHWLASIDPAIPLHLSRYHPAYHFNNPPTPLESLRQAREAARTHLKHVYIGNAVGFDNNTYCPGCGALLVEREGYYTKIVGLEGSLCRCCQEETGIVVS